MPALPSVEVHATASFEEAEAVAPGGGLRGGLLLAEHLDLGLGGELFAGPGGLVRADARWLPGEAAAGRLSAWIGLTGGILFADGVKGAGGPDVGIELPLGRLGARVGVSVLFSDEVWGLGSLGLSWRARPAAPAPTPVAAAPPTLSGLEVWLPHPVCVWKPIELAGADLAALPPGTRVRLAQRGRMSVEVDAAAAGDTALVEAPAQGGLAVAAAAADRVKVAGRELGLKDGAASLLAAEGVVRVELSGGGRALADEVVVSRGRVLWLNLPDPPDLLVFFPAGGAELDAEDRARIAGAAALLGDWAFEVSGGASPEGDAAGNTLLARRRAEGVQAALVAAGLPADRVRLGEAFAPDPGRPVEEQRVARIRPVPR